MSCPSIRSSGFIPNAYVQQPSFDLKTMLKEAQSYVDQFVPPTFGNGTDVEVLAFITDVLHNPSFQSDPQDYIADWENRRIDVEKLIVPDDLAFKFFEDNFITKEE